MARIAVVTGGTAGIGLATAELFAKRGWAVAVIARDPERLAQVRDRLAVHGRPVLALAADVADAEAVAGAAERVERELGPIDAWVNNAMATIVNPADRITPEEYRRVTETTYLSQVYGTLAALRSMKPRNRGAIIQVSSGLAIRAAPLQAPYCAAKFAVTGFTDALRCELIHDRVGVSLSIVYLPAVNTPQFNWARNRTGHGQYAPDPVYDPRLCAEAIVATAVTPQRDVWVGRSVLMMHAAQVIAPGFADRKAASMWDAQLTDAPAPDKAGNLFAPVPGPARIDGRFGDRTETTRSEYWTSRERDWLLAGLGGLAAIGFVGALALARGPRRLPPRR
ncbi:SDR family NAD(P)-dependent oxidoreductase [Methylobacterium sp. WL69]|uniref:SDR family oxidoreductase n=1 Tax=Methylobacterium sp. WL69 TaxID=2603893 RepID=UPI0011C72378|nr:SDR family oxidoreductase [Methylobacterium sp. WL69]TXM74007.1 SDR family NAD(P)-dependent oxidoreductase [Methylobacterium sp. WL69]